MDLQGSCLDAPMKEGSKRALSHPQAPQCGAPLPPPLTLSSSYLTLDPRGISMTALKTSGASSPMLMSCQAWETWAARCAMVDGGEGERRSAEEREVGDGRSDGTL